MAENFGALHRNCPYACTVSLAWLEPEIIVPYHREKFEMFSALGKSLKGKYHICHGALIKPTVCLFKEYMNYCFCLYLYAMCTLLTDKHFNLHVHFTLITSA